VAKTPRNQRNPRLMNYLCAHKAPYEALFWSFFVVFCTFCAFWGLKTPFNQRNQRLMNYLRAFGIFTLVKMSLQINLFMQNKPNFRKSQMNVSNYITKVYEKMDTWWSGKNEPKTNPKRTRSKPISVSIAPFIVYNYGTVQERPIHKFVAHESRIERRDTKPVLSAAEGYEIREYDRRSFSKVH